MPKKRRTKAGLLGRLSVVKAASPEPVLVFQVMLMMSVLTATGIVLWRWFAGKAFDVDSAQLALDLAAVDYPAARLAVGHAVSLGNRGSNAAIRAVTVRKYGEIVPLSRESDEHSAS